MPAGNTARLYRIEALIRQHGHVSFATLRAELEVSPATLKRDFEFLRSRMGAPIEYDAGLRGYRFGSGYAGQQRHELPGLWFDEPELHALLTAQQVLSGLDNGGLLSRHLQPLLDRIQLLLAQGQGADSALEVTRRVLLVSATRRPVAATHFERVSAALFARKRLHIRYLARTRAEVSQRDVSPQRLVNYRNTWYLDAWCHRAEGLRRFSLDAMQQTQVLDQGCKNVALKTVQAQMDAGYGIFAGGQSQTAVLLFNPTAAQWASCEEWHPLATGRWLADGSYEMTLPFADATELVMDLMRQGDQVCVLSPASLAAAVHQHLLAAAALYTKG